MIPLYDENPTKEFPYVTIALISLNFAVYIYELMLLVGGRLEPFILQYSLIATRLQAQPAAGILTIFTALFLHASFVHVGGNMLFLWIFGNNIEDLLGHWAFLAFYLACGVAASLSQVLFSLSSPIPNLGASGAIAGVLGAYIIMYPKARIITLIPLFFLFPLVSLPAVFMLGLWIVLQLFNGIASIAGGLVGGVAWFAHIGGFIFGMLAIKFLPKARQRNPLPYA